MGLCCKNCGERMEGDGYQVVYHCPNVDAEGYEPDANPIHCDGNEEVDRA